MVEFFRLGWGFGFARYRPMRFVCAGGIATVSHWLLMAALIGLGQPELLATVVGSVSGALVNFFAQRHLTFRDRPVTHMAVWPYAWTCLLSWLINAWVFHLCFAWAGWPVAVAQGLATLMAAWASYFLYGRLVFRQGGQS
ncbi:polysaccharide biosynthesis protein GtrA [Hylemonella gracilis str. Niagara R]|uniref:Polysaccharide biosynthesis protein GtrA n=1 Tax=Hylemonella gracilis str. Niagara R TaxID=1458275 RepID=A0A016XI74_9BURK|nr:GtrA family protein [Hylemonella gracilis]EYC51570.1 polysaccharide biosynthesis protein GtrA [Hylemonella gracilis str. Niagara R]